VSEPVISAATGHALLNALAWMIYAMDQADEDVIDTDNAVAWMEEVASILDRLASEDRRDLAALSRVLADKTSDEQYRHAYLAFIEGYGLDEDED
jgi:hypothetical protein